MYFEIRKQKYLEALDRCAPPPFPTQPQPLPTYPQPVQIPAVISTGTRTLTRQLRLQEGSHWRYQNPEEGSEDLPGTESGNIQRADITAHSRRLQVPTSMLGQPTLSCGCNPTSLRLTITYAVSYCHIRQNEKLAVYGDTANARALMLQELSSLAEANPALRDKMVFPQMAMSSLRNLFVQRSGCCKTFIWSSPS